MMFGNKKGIKMKNLILKWLGLDKISQSNYQNFKELWETSIHDIYKDIFDLKRSVNTNNDYHGNHLTALSKSLDSRRNEINGIIETLQNLDNHEVIADLHKRIQNLEKKGLQNG